MPKKYLFTHFDHHVFFHASQEGEGRSLSMTLFLQSTVEDSAREKVIGTACISPKKSIVISKEMRKVVYAVGLATHAPVMRPHSYQKESLTLWEFNV